MLGRSPEVEGVVEAGQKRGRDLGFPTANIAHHRLAAVPADGVYAGTATVGDRSYIAAISVGTNPTFEGVRRTVEAYLLDFDGDLYGQRLRVGFTARLRDTLAFGGVEQLVAQMEADVAQTLRIME
jgi:riboflavin kinase/FMN adenylyltransferase